MALGSSSNESHHRQNDHNDDDDDDDDDDDEDGESVFGSSLDRSHHGDPLIVVHRAVPIDISRPEKNIVVVSIKFSGLG